ncbi:MAG TPA: hypothetical protein VJ508_12820 [Saprospiraceae bacterium]|nr:hypothetical protein [Saprospiraceae bacterium]
MRIPVTLLFLSFLYIGQAQDRLFTYTYQSNVLNAGQQEIEVWNTMLSGKADYYRKLAHRLEFETGLGHKLQTAFYLNLDQSFNGPVDLGFSNEWKWKLTDPVANAVGLALYGELGIESGETELEGKILLDKQTGRFLHAINLVVEEEWGKITVGPKTETEKATIGDLHYALSFRINSGFNIGFESMLRNAWSSGNREFTTLFAGPCISLANENFWINATFLPQLSSLYSVDDTSNGLDLTHHTKNEIRIIFSFEL